MAGALFKPWEEDSKRRISLQSEFWYAIILFDPEIFNWGDAAMRLKDIAHRIREGDRTDFVHALDGSGAIRALDTAAVASLPETVFIRDAQNCLVGKVDRDLLLYLMERQQGGRFEKILNRMSDGVIAVDETGRIYYANPAYTTVLGVPLRKIMGKFIQDIEPGSLLNRALLEQAPQVSEKQLVPSVGKYVSLRAYPLWDGETYLGAVSIFKDVTQLHQLNQEVQHMTGIVDEFSRQLQSQTIATDLGMITNNKTYHTTMEQAVAVARTDVPLLIRGESGTGKDVLAHFLHRCSSRRDKPLIIVNCAAIPDSLMESELFGYESGAFTGADKGGRKGKFELADGGTIFLDEIGDMPLLMQSKLLRVLQQGEIEKIGRQSRLPVDVRVIAATNQPLEQLITEKRFRQDLFFRINTVMLTIPPLRERPEDIAPLTNQFLKEYNEKYQKEVVFTPDVYHKIQRYTWPGNVRELRNYVERTVILTGNDWRKVEPPLEVTSEEVRSAPPAEDFSVPLDARVRAFERQAILAELERTGGNRTEAMERLHLSRRTFYRKCAELQICVKK